MKAVEEAAATGKYASQIAAEEEAIKEAASQKTADDKANINATQETMIKRDSPMRAAAEEEAGSKTRPSEKPVHRTSLLWTAILLLITAPLLVTKTSLSTCLAPMMASTTLTATLPGSSAHCPTTVHMYIVQGAAVHNIQQER